MIFGAFRSGGDVAEVVVDGTNLLFKSYSSNQITTIEGLSISKHGVLIEHPDLKDDPQWKTKAIERVKQKVKEIDGEVNRLIYVKDELSKFGWTPLYYQKAGHRPRKW